MPAGSFDWLELITTDPTAAEEFYGPLLGWTFQDRNGDRLILANQIEVGEIAQDDGSNAPPHWLPYIHVPTTIEDAIRAVEANGGKHLRSDEIAGDVRWATLTDPDGAVVAAIQNLHDSEPKPTVWPTPIGTASWYAIAGTDLAATASFYASVFGYDQPDPTEEFSIINTPVLTTGSTLRAGVLPASEALQPRWIPYFVVADADQILTSAIDLGGKPITPVMAIPQIGRILGITDPQGATFFAHQPE